MRIETFSTLNPKVTQTTSQGSKYELKILLDIKIVLEILRTSLY